MGDFRRFRFPTYAEANKRCKVLAAQKARGIKLIHAKDGFLVTAEMPRANDQTPVRSIRMCCSLPTDMPDIHTFVHPEKGSLATWTGIEQIGAYKVFSLATGRFRIMTKEELDDCQPRSEYVSDNDGFDELACIMFMGRYLKDAGECDTHYTISAPLEAWYERKLIEKNTAAPDLPTKTRNTPFESWIQKKLTKLVGKSAYEFQPKECIHFYTHLIAYHRSFGYPAMDPDERTHFALVAQGFLQPATTSNLLWRHYVAYAAYERALALDSANYEKCISLMCYALQFGCLEAIEYLKREQSHLKTHFNIDLEVEFANVPRDDQVLDVSHATPSFAAYGLYLEKDEAVAEKLAEKRNETSQRDWQWEGSPNYENRIKAVAEDHDPHHFEADLGNIQDDLDGASYEFLHGGPDSD